MPRLEKFMGRPATAAKSKPKPWQAQMNAMRGWVIASRGKIEPAR